MKVNEERGKECFILSLELDVCVNILWNCCIIVYVKAFCRLWLIRLAME